MTELYFFLTCPFLSSRGSCWRIVLFFFFSSRRRHTRCLSDWSSDVCSSDLDDQDDHDHQFEHERTTLVELVHHETVEVFGGIELLLHQVLIIRHANFSCGQPVQTGRKHVAQELDGIVGALGELRNIQQDGVQARGGFGQPPAGEPTHALLQYLVNRRQLQGQQL